MRKRVLALYFAMLSAGSVVGVACKDATAPPAPAAIAFTKAAPAVATAGTALPLQVEVTDRKGSPISGVAVDWSVTAGSLSPSSAVTDSRGRSETLWSVGAERGAQSATARAGGFRATTAVHIREQVAASLHIMERPIRFSGLAEARAPNVVLRDSLGNELPGSADVVWTSADSSIVTGHGREVRSVRPGTTLLTAAYGALTDTVPAEVVQVPGSVTVPYRVIVRPGDTARIHVQVRDTNGQLIPEPVLTWEVGNAGTATVSADGVVKGVAVGATEVTVRCGLPLATVAVEVVHPADYFFLTLRVSSPGGETIAEWTSPDRSPGATWPTGPGALLTELVGAPDRSAASLGASFMPAGYLSFRIADVPGPFRVGTYRLGPGPQSELVMKVDAHRYLLQGRAPLPWAALYGGGWDHNYHWVTGTFASSLHGELVVDTVRAPSRPHPLAEFGGDGLLVGRFAVRAFASVWSGPGAPPGEILLAGHFRVPYGHRLEGHADVEVLQGPSTGTTIGRPTFGRHAASVDYPAFHTIDIHARVPGPAEDAGFFRLEVVTRELDVGTYPLSALTGDTYQDPLRRPATCAALSWPDPTGGSSLFLSTGGVLRIEKSRPRSDDEYGELTGTIELDAMGWDLRPGGGETGETVRVRARFNIP
jgi:hypothetical protein